MTAIQSTSVATPWFQDLNIHSTCEESPNLPIHSTQDASPFPQLSEDDSRDRHTTTSAWKQGTEELMQILQRYSQIDPLELTQIEEKNSSGDEQKFPSRYFQTILNPPVK